MSDAIALFDPAERSARGAERQAHLLGTSAPEPETLLESSWRDFIFAEVWTRPGLDLRSRYIVALAGAAAAQDLAAATGFARGALKNGELALSELREAALHLGVYGGWGQGAVVDRAVTAAADELGLAAADSPPLRAEPWDPAQRHRDGQANFDAVMTFGGPPPVTAYFEGGIVNFVFGEMWMRPGLDQRTRRWITLVGVANSAAYVPIHSHVYAAMKSGNTTQAEMFEFVLQYAIHAGWPRASVVQGAVMEQGKRVADGLPFDAKPQ